MFLLYVFHTPTDNVGGAQSEYKAIVERIVDIAVKCRFTELNMDFEKELTKRAEAESQAKIADARMAEANASVRLLELQIELKRMEMSARV